MSLVLSYTSLTDHNTCPLKYKFRYIDKLDYRIDRPYLSFGRSIHDALGYFYKLDQKERTLENLKKYFESTWLTVGYSSIEEQLDYKRRGWRILENFFEKMGKDVNIVSTEEYFKVPIEDFLLSGRIDRIDRKQNGIEIVDYKTGIYDPKPENLKNDLQLKIYALGYYKLKNEMPASVAVIKPETLEYTSVGIDSSDINWTLEKIIEYAKTILSDTKFEPREGDWCNVCDFYSICPLKGFGLKPVQVKEVKEEIREEVKIELNEYISKLERMRNNLYGLYRAAVDISSTLDLNILGEKIVNVFLKFSNSEKAIVVYFEEKPRVIASSGIKLKKDDELDPGIVKNVKELFVNGMLDTGESICLIYNDMKDKEHIKNLFGPGEKISNAAVVTLYVAENFIGYIGCADKKGGSPYTEEDRILLSNLGAIASAQIKNTINYELAIRDGLTKLYTYRYFQRRLDEELSRARRHRSYPISLIMMDIDDFKKINDKYGHLEGDDVLKAVAQTIQKHTRLEDIQVRYGGEEFAILLPTTGSAGAIQVAENLKNRISSLSLKLRDEDVKITVSCGVALYDFQESKEEFIDRADMALYQAKKQGKNRVVFLDKIPVA